MKASTSPRRRADVLTVEHQHGRISTAALAAGRTIEDMLARAEPSTGQHWHDRVDTSRQPDAAVIRALEVARQAAATMSKVEQSVGPVDARLLRRVLGDGMNFDQVAQAEGRSGERAASYFGQRCRDALEELGRAYIAIGRAAPKVVDKHS